MRQLGLAAITCLLAGVALQADTLVLRDGRQINGRVVAMRDGQIEFEQQRGFFGGRETIRVDRADVRRIEFDADDARGGDVDRGRDRDTGGGPSRPSGMREREIWVDATKQWTDTGVDVRPGQTVYIEPASGTRIEWRPGHKDGPAGESDSPRNGGRPMPNRAAGALIGRVGDGAEYFYIGDDRGPTRMRSGGRLFLGINDDNLRDNSGAFKVTVYY